VRLARIQRVSVLVKKCAAHVSVNAEIGHGVAFSRRYRVVNRGQAASPGPDAEQRRRNRVQGPRLTDSVRAQSGVNRDARSVKPRSAAVDPAVLRPCTPVSSPCSPGPRLHLVCV